MLYQRAVLLNQLGRRDEAEVDLQEVLELARAGDQTDQQTRALGQLSSIARAGGDFDAAERYARDAIEAARSRPALTARATIGLGAVLMLQGDGAAARPAFLEALRVAELFGADRSEGRAQLMLGSLALSRNDLDEADQYTRSGLEFYREGNYRTEISQALSILGEIDNRRGNLDQAEATFRELLALGRELGNDRTVARAHYDLASVLERRGDYPGAVSEQTAGISLLAELGDAVSLAYARTDRTKVLSRLGRVEDARTSLEALDIDGQPERLAAQLRPTVLLVEARLALVAEDVETALDRAQQAVRLAADTGDESIGIEAMTLLAAAQARRGNATAAVARSAEAHTRAQVLGDPVLTIMTLLPQAEARLAAGQGETALALAVEALDEAESREQWVQAWHAAVLARLASSDVGDAAGVTAYKTRQDELLNHLRAQWGDAAVDQYVRRPDIAVLLT